MKRDAANKQGDEINGRKKAVEQDIALYERRLQDAKVNQASLLYKQLTDTPRPISKIRDVSASTTFKRKIMGSQIWTRRI